MFYVYEFRDQNGVPFYIGKGSKKRWRQHEAKARAGRKSPFYNKLRKLWREGHQHTKAIVFETLFEAFAFDEEKRLIAYYGRASLTNQTDGGDGPANPTAETRAKIAAGRRGIVASEATRNRQRLAALKRAPQTEETKQKIAAYQTGTKKPWARAVALRNLEKIKYSGKGRTWTDKQRQRFKEARTGHKVTQATRDKISQSKKGTPAWNKGRVEPGSQRDKRRQRTKKA